MQPSSPVRLLMHSVFVILLFFIACSADYDEHFLRNHTVISISGWPQSGTSLLNEFLLRTPGVSTMVDKCSLFHTVRKCIGFNFEGQWILPGCISHRVSTL
mmetsp:Transcript_8773/g.13129  ORF Transcript_8773/g.13129 Transcript_8773/m.13129 type:complete len:101 (+) Transcript_8773:66-368(+)